MSDFSNPMQADETEKLVVADLPTLYKSYLKLENVNTIVFFALSFFFCYAMVLCPEIFLGYDYDYFAMRSGYYSVSAAILCFLFVALSFLARKLWRSTLLTGFICLVLGTANYFKIGVHGVPLLPQDVFAMRDVLSPAHFAPTLPMLLYVLFILLYALLLAPVNLPSFVRNGKNFFTRAAKRVGYTLLFVAFAAIALHSTFLNDAFVEFSGTLPDNTITTRYSAHTFYGTFFGLTFEGIVHSPKGAASGVPAQLETFER